MKKLLIILLSITLLVNCTDDLRDATDFTSIENPNLLEPLFLGQPNSSSVWLEGMDRQMSLFLNEILILAELGSDNYENTQTFYSQFLDNLEIRIDDPDIRDTQNDLARLREMADYGLEEVGPQDPLFNEDTEAEYNFFKGMSNLYAGMYFSRLPEEPGAVPLTAEENYASAISSFTTAIGLNNKPEYYLARARAYYYLGRKAEAVADAQMVIALDSDLLRFARFDETDTTAQPAVNIFENALYERAIFDDLQPLPTLDFLDPKYSFVSPEEDAPIYYLKAEEAYLILAEANLSDGNDLTAQQNMTDLLSLIDTREVRSIDDTIEGRTQRAPGSRPDSTHVVVNGRSDLVLYRGTTVVIEDDGSEKVVPVIIDIPSISGTSLTQTEIDGISNDDAALELLYRTRQEVFMAEGIRFADMGVKLVMDLNEILLNDNVAEGDPGTVAIIPPFINAVKNDLDGFTYDAEAGITTTTIDLNAILVANKNSDDVLPFN